MNKNLLKEVVVNTIHKWADRAVVENKHDGASVYNPYNAESLADAIAEALNKNHEERKEVK